jgi:hypothetical protein
MTKAEIKRDFDAIVAFAETEKFLDTPVKRYSSGMYVRLAFAVAAHLEPEILVVDEVLAVGDAAFQAKCYDRINDLKERGTTIVFISHDLNAVEFLCDRALLLSYGEIVADGLPGDVIKQYERDTNRSGIAPPARENLDTNRPIQITRLTFHDNEGCEVPRAFTGMPLMARIEFEAHEPLSDIVFEVCYYSQAGKLQCQFSTSVDCEQLEIDCGEGAVHFSCAELGLQPGLYYADATIKQGKNREEIDWQYRSAVLRVDPGKTVSGRFYSPHRWRIARDKDEVLLTPAFYKLTAESQAVKDHE